MRDVVILDRGNAPGFGSTGRATGGYRAQFATRINVKLSLRSREKLLSFAEETGVDSGYSPVGYLWLACNDSHLEALHAGREIQNQEGLTEARAVSVHQIEDLNPHISTRGIVGGAFCGSDGYIRPLEILRGYLDAAGRLGVETVWNAECQGFDVVDGRVAKVRTSAGDFDAEVVVNAAGPWAAGVARLAGVSLPVWPLRRQALVTELTEALPPDMPMTIFMDNGFHLRVRDGRALACWPSEDSSPRTDLDADNGWLESVSRMIDERVPALRGVPVDRAKCYAGLYEMSPDHHAIVGFAPECANMFLVNGSSGHGVMHSPALGEIAADVICGVEPPIDITDLRPSRFTDGSVLPPAELL